MSGKHKRKNSTVVKEENQVLKQLLGKMVYVLGASAHEINRFIDNGAEKSENTDIILSDYAELLEIMGIESIDPKTAKEGENG